MVCHVCQFRSLGSSVAATLLPELRPDHPFTSTLVQVSEGCSVFAGRRQITPDWKPKGLRVHLL
jgi:hypothetical protein